MKTLKTLLIVLLGCSIVSASGLPNTTFGHHEGNAQKRGIPTTTRNYGLYRICGGTTSSGPPQINDSTAWPQIETARGVYNWTNLDAIVNIAGTQGGKTLIFCPWRTPAWANTVGCGSGGAFAPCTGGANEYPPDNIQDWKDFVTQAVTRYDGAHGHGRIKYWEVWNEPNTFWFNKASTTTALDNLAQMALAAYPIMSGVSGNQVLMPSPQGTSLANANSYLSKYMDSAQAVCTGVGNNTCLDIVSFHGYLGAQNTTPDSSIVNIVTRIQSDMTAHSIGSLPLWDDENSWALNSGFSDPDLQAAWVVRHNVSELACGVTTTIHFMWSLLGPNPPQAGDYGGMWTRETGPTVLAGQAWEQEYDWLVGSTLTNGGCPTVAAHVYSVTLTRPNSTVAQILWRDTSNTDCSGVACTCSAGLCTTANFTPGTQYTRWQDLTGNTFNIPGTRLVPLGVKPIMLTSDAPVNAIEIEGQGKIEGKGLID